MATKINPLKPYIFTINQSILDRIEQETGEYQSFYGQAGRYYYYTVYRGENYSKILYTGKTWSYYNDLNEVEVKVNLEDIVKAFMYDSYSSLKPVFNEDEQEYDLIYVDNGTTIRPICSDVDHYERNGFGRTQFTVALFAYPDEVGRISNRLCWIHKDITSSWNINGLVYTQSDNYIWQNLLALEYSNFVSHYPKTLTDEYSISWVMNVGNNFVTNSGPSYRIGNSDSSGQYIEVGSYSTSGIYQDDLGGYVALNIKLSDIVPYLQYGEYTPGVEQYQFNSVIPGASSTLSEWQITTGTSAEYTPDNIFICGDATERQGDIPGVDETNNVYIWTHYTSLLTPSVDFKKFKIGIVDTCTKPYYLKWMTRSCCPVSWGFDGNTVRSSKYKQTFMKDVYRTDVLKINDVEDKWELRSGIVDKDTYKVFEDIFTSPYVILYSTTEDKSYYVKVDDSNYTIKNNTKVDKQPYHFEINISKADETKLVY